MYRGTIQIDLKVFYLANQASIKFQTLFCFLSFTMCLTFLDFQM